MDRFVVVMASIPDAVWPAFVAAGGAIAGAIIAWAGVWFQLRHSSRERERERQATLRRDVYLPAAKQFGAVLTYLATYYDATEPGPREYSSALAQIHVTGTNDTLEAAIRLNDYLNESFLGLAADKAELQVVATLQENVDSRQKEALVEMYRWIEEMKQYNLRGETDARKWEIIQSNYKFAEGHVGQIGREYAEVIRKRLRLSSELAQKCMTRYQKADELLIPLLVAVRKELNTPFDEEAYRHVEKQSRALLKKHMDDYIVSLKAKADEWLDDAESES